MSLNTFENSGKKMKRRVSHDAFVDVLDDNSSTGGLGMYTVEFNATASGDEDGDDNGAKVTTSGGASSATDASSSNRPKIQTPPPHAVESARRFLWDEDDDEHQVPSRMFGVPPSANDAPNNGIPRREPPTSATSSNVRNLHSLRDNNNDGEMLGFGDTSKMTDRTKDKQNKGDNNLWARFVNGFNEDKSEPKKGGGDCTRNMVVLLIVVTLIAPSTLYLINTGAFDWVKTNDAPPTPEDINGAKYKNIILESGITEASDFDNPRSPQSKALAWLASGNDSPQNFGMPEVSFSLEDDDIDSRGLLQRYAVAVLYYSANMARTPWSSEGGWLKSMKTCSWEGIQCQKRAKANNGDEEGASRHQLRGMDDAEVELVTKPITITSLNLSDGKLSGTVPRELSALVNLETLLLGSNHIKGSIPDEIGALSKLKRLNFESNHLEGTIPDTFGKLKSLVYLNLGSNQLMGTIHAELGNLQNLKQLHVEDNELLDAMPTTICALRDVSLSVLSADCGGEQPEIVCDCCTKCTP